jgi:hypothetical protein
MRNFFRYVGIAVPVCLLVISCATTTKLTHIWTDEAYRGSPVSDVLVIGVSDKEAVRRSFEDKFVKQLKETGIEAVSSAAAISSDKELDKEAIVSSIKKLGVDAVLVTHLLGVDKEEKYHPPTGYVAPAYYRRGYYGYYGQVYDHVHTPGYYTTYTKVRLETNLYEAKTEDLIWSGQSETWDPTSKMEVIDSVISVVIKNLQKNKLLPQK